MTDPTPLYYQTPPPASNDISNLKVLGILHYVWGGMIMLFSCFGIIYIVMGIMILSGNPAMKGAFAPGTSPGAPPGPPPELFGYMFTGMGGCIMIFGWALGILSIISGRKMAARRSRIFSIVVAGINCISFPLGTLLGVFTIIVLSKQSVKELYGNGP